MELPFGKRVQVGNYVVTKFTKTLSKKELKSLRDAEGVPNEVRKYLHRACLPYIKVATVSGNWSIEWCMGTTVYESINDLEVAHDDKNNFCYYGDGYRALLALLNRIYMTSNTVGDKDYNLILHQAIVDYMDRASKQSKGEPTPEEEAENEQAAQEAFEHETNKEVLHDMAEQIKTEEE